MLTMAEQHTVKTLYKQGTKKADIARQLHCHRHTVDNILKRPSVIEKQTRSKPSAVAPYKAQIKKWYEAEITRQRIHEMLVENYQVPFSYDAVRKYVKKHIAKPAKAYGVQQHLPGEYLEADFGDITVFLEDLQRRVRYQALGFVFPFSGAKYCALLRNQKLQQFCAGFEEAFTYYGGVPKRVKTDNLKAAVIKNTPKELELNQSYFEFANHYGFVIRPCTPYSPEQKGSVERFIRYLKDNFLPGRIFKNEADLKRQLRDWCDMVNQKIHGTTKKCIQTTFINEEKPLLMPLPDNPFAFFNTCERNVGQNCHIQLENNYYSVPFTYCRKQVTVRWNDAIVRIVHAGHEVTVHKKAAGIGTYITRREHLPSGKTYSESEYRQLHGKKMESIGPHGRQYYDMILEKAQNCWQQRVRSIYQLVDSHGKAVVDKALYRALTYNVSDIPTIRAIIDQGLYDLVDVEEAVIFADHENSRDAAYYRGGLREEAIA